MKDKAKINRIHAELKEAGMTNYGLLKIPTGHLPDLINDDENIKGVVYGRLDNNFGSVMLVATTKRILFLDYKPLYRNYDEITYDVVAGIQLSAVGIFAGVVLHTRVRDYSLKFVNLKCAEIFTKYIEKHLEKGSEFAEKNKKSIPETKPYKQDENINQSAKKNNIILDTNTAVLSTVNPKNEAHASVVHYLIDSEENFYFMTKADSTKAKNIAHNNSIAFTIHHTGSLKSLLIKGSAIEVNNPEISKLIYNLITSPKEYLEGKKLPPITKLGLSTNIVYKITAETSQLQDFSIYSW